MKLAYCYFTTRFENSTQFSSNIETSSKYVIVGVSLHRCFLSQIVDTILILTHCNTFLVNNVDLKYQFLFCQTEENIQRVKEVRGTKIDVMSAVTRFKDDLHHQFRGERARLEITLL